MEMNQILPNTIIQDSCTNISPIDEIKQEINKLKLVTSILVDDIDKINRTLNSYVVEGCM